MKSLVRLIPRVALGVLALGLLVFLIAQLPFWPAPEMEPMASSTTIAVERESEDRVAIDLSADPGQVPLYRIAAQPVPDTPEAMLAWARDFGLPDPAVYERPSSDDPARYVVGSDGRRLIFQSAGSTGEIFYLNPQAATAGEPLPFAEASQIAIDFLQEHNLLPDAYQVDEPMFASAPGTGQRSVVIRVTVAEGVIGNLNDLGSTLHVNVAADGQVASAFLRQLVVETAELVEVISAQEAYEKLLAGEIVGSSRGETGGINQMGTTSYTPPANWQVGEAVDIAGHLELLVSVTDDSMMATLSANANSATFHLKGDRLTELAAETWQQAYRVQGVVTAQLDPSVWEFEIQDWQHVSYNDMSCLMGELVRQDDVTRFRSDEGHEYGLPQAPAEIVAGERLQICLSLPDEPGTDLAWSMIHVPPPSEQVISGSGGGSMVQSAVVVEQVSEVEVTRIVTQVDGGEETAVIPTIPPPSGSVSTGSEETFTEPQSPYNLGDRVEMIGFVQAVRLVNDAGSYRLELQITDDSDPDPQKPRFSYLLLAPVELMEEMAAHVELHIRVVGEIVAAPEDAFFMTASGQAIAVESFDRPWPEERLENFLGHFTVEEIEGQQRVIFIDHLTDVRYVVDPQFPVMGDLHFSEEQGLLTAVVNPNTEPIGGLPVLLNRGFATGSDIATATDLSQFPAPTENRIGTINEAFLRGNEIGENDVIERVELVYAYDSYSSQSAMGAQPAEPMWVFYGRNAQGNLFFTMSVRAVR